MCKKGKQGTRGTVNKQTWQRFKKKQDFRISGFWELLYQVYCSFQLLLILPYSTLLCTLFYYTVLYCTVKYKQVDMDQVLPQMLAGNGTSGLPHIIYNKI